MKYKGLVAFGLISVGLAGCISDSKNSGLEFRVQFSGEIGPAYSRTAAGAVQQSLGFGAEAKAGADEELALESAYWGIFQPLDSAILDTAMQEDPSFPPYEYNSLVIRRDSTFVLRLDGPTPFSPLYEIQAEYAGSPCKFSAPRGYQIGPNAYNDTIPLVISDVRFTASTDSLRFTMVIDTAASKAANPRVNFTRREFYGTVQINCP
jgi:hypothetical protein